VTYRFDAERRDRYGRALVYLHAGGRFVNAELVRGGFAAPLRVPPNTRHAGELDRLAGAARDAGRGLWGAC
jgi:micrococcal nuclease